MQIFHPILGDQHAYSIAAPDDDDLAHAALLVAEVADETVYVCIRASAGHQCSLYLPFRSESSLHAEKQPASFQGLQQLNG